MGLTEIEIKNHIKVTVPDSLKLMTHYVLREQGDWFEDEIEFVRRFIKPGMKAIDIGANYGVYTLTIAGQIGERGKLWAFEPASATADCLETSIKSNKFRNIKLIRAGLSNKSGNTTLYLSDNSELNSLTKLEDSGAASESIRLLTLDSCLNEYKWHDIDFIKLDAEGEESNILKKGKRTLSELSPLVMFELKHFETVNQPLIRKFNELGYACYRLVTGLNSLIPFSLNDKIDAFLLNLFGCKQDKASQLEQDGIIINKWDSHQDVQLDIVDKFLAGTAYWNETVIAGGGDSDNEYMRLLASYLASKSEEFTMSVRMGFLMSALDMAKTLLAKNNLGVERLCTLARVVFDAGERMLGVKILSDLAIKYQKHQNYEIKTAFLPACARYEQIEPQGKIEKWLYASIVEQLLLKFAYSAYFAPQQASLLYSLLKNTGFMDEGMRKRQELVLLRNG